MKQKIDLNKWVRKPQFDHFVAMDEPFYGVCVNIDCTRAYETAKKMGVSFFLFYLYQSLLASNAVDAFRYRIEGDEVYLYDDTKAAVTIDRPDETFGFGYFDFYPDFSRFVNEASLEIEKIRAANTLEPSSLDNAIHYSAAPWVNFTSLSHPRRFSIPDSCPKITFGKMTTDANGNKSMPVSIHVHHALVFGRDIGMFVDTFQKLMNQ